MADGSGEPKRKRKRRRGDERRKLLPGDKVEVLSTEEGLIGSWHGGVVLSCGKGSRLFEYNDLLSDDNYLKLVESVPVSAAIDGRALRTLKRHRGQIRPVPPHYEFKESKIRYGLCVDALVDEAWWEGVVFDHAEGSTERMVFFPDQGDQQMIAIDRLRLTQDWNEVSGIWKPRGEWMLLQVLETFEQDDPLPVSTREIWYDLRTTAAFLNDIGLWIFGSQSSWHKLVSELIHQLLSIIDGLPEGGGTSNQLIDVQTGFCDVNIPIEDIPCLEGPKHPFDNAGTHINLADSSSSGKCANRIHSHEATENEAVENSLGEVCRRGANPMPCLNELSRKKGFCPEALSRFISEYDNRLASRTQSSRENPLDIREKAKARLLAVGWKFKASDLGHKYYVSPSGEKYRSFIKACRACEEMESHDILNHNRHTNLLCDVQGAVEADNIHAHAEKKVDGQTNPEVTTSWQPSDLEPMHYPEVIALCARSIQDEKGQQKKSKAASDNHHLVRLRAKKHLRALGWKIESKRDMQQRMRVLSPEGKYYYSLRTACLHLLKEHQIKKHKFRGDSTPKSVSFTRSCSVKENKLQIEHSGCTFQRSVASGDSMLKSLGKCRRSKKQKAHHGLVREYHKSRCSSTPRPLRPSKRSREVLASTSTTQVPRTVLSLLIDNDMVLPRQKVSYIRRRDGHVMMEGRVTRDGIKCKCCSMVYTLTNFEAHAGSTNHRPAANIFLQDGRSLLECQMQMVHKKKPKNIPNRQLFSHPRLKSDCSVFQSDTICSVCRDVGMLVLCDHCPSSFHLGCVGLEDVPKGKWFCPSCRCRICGLSEFNSDTGQFTEKTILYCDQCEREYHVGCSRQRGLTMLISCPVGKWFCSKKCKKIFLHLQKLLGKPRPTAKEGLSWTILRSSKEDGVEHDQFDVETRAEHHSKLCVALDVLHECFVTIIEPRTRSDVAADIVFNKESELNRLNFWGFYTMLLERGDELISVATFRVYGEKVAEIPLVGTRVKYRRQGMCRLLINELEKLLYTLGVERLMLPAVPQLLATWTKSFGFTKMTSSDRSDFLEYSVVNFQDTTLCQKLLGTAPKDRKKQRGKFNQLAGRSREMIEKEDYEMHSIITEVVEMVEPIKILSSAGKGDTIEETTYPTNSVHCSSVSSLQIEMSEQASSNVARAKCRENSILVETSPTDVVEKPIDVTSKFMEKYHSSVGKTDADREYLNTSVIGGLNTFKYFYRRRISAK